MKISVIVPSYNQAAYLGATLDSLAAQGYAALDVRVYDGGSKDGSVEVLRNHPAGFRWISERDHGQADAINRGLRETDGEVVAYLNSDDVYYPGALHKVAAYFSAHPECCALYGDAHHLNPDGSVMEPYYTEPWGYRRLQEVCYLCQPAVFWRRQVVEQFGLFDDQLQFAMDYDYWLRVGRRVPFHHLRGEFLAGSRLHADTKTLSQKARVHREILNVVIRHGGSEAAVLRWLGHLAFHEATEQADPHAQEPASRRKWMAGFVAATLLHAARLDIRLPAAKIGELETHLANVGA